MTICNMSIDAGARAGRSPGRGHHGLRPGCPHAPQGEDWDAAVQYRRTLHTDEGAEFHRRSRIDADQLSRRHVGHQPRPGCAAVAARAGPGGRGDDNAKGPARRAWTTWASSWLAHL
ncbi:hypothetical protein QJS66_00745 [Kocuria rhizophila]|nr:hypothetical protein QJS66_00745 [Kocuria rhizophila]